MRDEITPEELARVRRWVAAGQAPWWARFLWGRDVHEPHLRTWRACRAIMFVLLCAACVLLAVFPPVGRVLVVVYMAAGGATIAARWIGVSRAQRGTHGR